MHSTATRSRRASAFSCTNGCALLNRNALCILLEPLSKRLQSRIQITRALDTPRCTEHVLELGVELEHVRKVVGTGKAKPCVFRRCHRDVPNRLAERERQLLCHLRTGQMLTCDSDRLAD